jgi:hypothetical protein
VQLGDTQGRCAQDQQAAEHRGNCSAERIERLNEIQSARGCLRVAEHHHVRVGGDLQTGNTRGQDNERAQKQWE